MTSRSADHSTFVMQRRLSAPVARVFAAWSNAEKKRRWFACHDDWKTADDRLDFRVGGTEKNLVERPDGVRHAFNARFFDIVPDQRIIYAYEVHVGEVRISVSLVTMVFTPKLASTDMIFTEQVVLLDGHGQLEERRAGTEIGLDRLSAELA